MFRFSLFLFLLLGSRAISQQVRFKPLSLFQGLSQSTVNAIVQDRQGFVWIATQDGLNRFDGYSFKVFKHNPLDSNSIPDNYVQSLFRDSQGLIWIGTYGGGISAFDPVTGKFRRYKSSESPSSISSNQVMTICEDRLGDLWIGTSNGLNKFSKKENKFKRYLSGNGSDGLSSNKIRSVFCDRNNVIWIGTADKGLNSLDPANGKFKVYQADGRTGSISSNSVQFISENKKGELMIATSGGGVNILDVARTYFRRIETSKQDNIHYNDIWTVLEDSNENIWAGSYGAGLLKFDRTSGKLINYRNDPTDNSSLSNNVILCSYIDRQGFIWLGTLGGGVSYFDPHGSKFVNIRNSPNDPNSLNENLVMSIYRDPSGMYIGTYGGGLNIIKPSGKFQFYKNGKQSSSLPSNIVRAVHRDKKGRTWVGTYDGGLALMDENGKFKIFKNDTSDASSISSNDVWAIKEDTKGKLWIGTWGGGLNYFDPETEKFRSYRHSDSDPGSLSNDKVIALHIDPSGMIWAGTNGGGLNLFDHKAERFIHFRHSQQDSTSISSDRVRSIISDFKGRLWIGTDGGGLNRMNSNRIFQRFDERHGLPNNVVYGILEDSENNLWLSTNNGLCKFNQVSATTRNFDITDGLQGNEFNQGAYFKEKDGTMHFGGIGGISSFKPERISQNRYLPPVVITSIKLFGKEFEQDTSVSSLSTIRLSYDQNFFSFEFSALDLTAPEKNKYACKMEGFDKDWIFLGNKRFVSYTNLDPGEYIFRVIASNNENYWNNDGTSIRVIISPPFYKTRLFYLFMILLLIASVYLVISIRTRNLRAAKKQLEEEVSLRTTEVVRQKEIIEGKNKDITDSINYARRIQRAILPSIQNFRRAFPISFIFYRPKDIVSGDFYWIERFGDDVLVAVVDCTGHGVPGAFLSIVGSNLLNQAVNEHGISKPSLILNEMNKGLAKLIRNQNDIDIKDGMDMALCAWNSKTGILQFAGANNPVWIIRKDESILTEVKGDKMPIGSYGETENTLFTNHEIHLRSGDRFYLSTDGYADQFGGSQGKKLKKSGMKDIVLETFKADVAQQRKEIERHFDEWSLGFEQVDDVLLIGVEIS